MIILETFEDSEEFIYLESWDKIPKNSNPMNLSVKQLIAQDILNGTDNAGYRKYLPLLEKEAIVSVSDANKWRLDLPNIPEKPLPNLSK